MPIRWRSSSGPTTTAPTTMSTQTATGMSGRRVTARLSRSSAPMDGLATGPRYFGVFVHGESVHGPFEIRTWTVVCPFAHHEAPHAAAQGEVDRGDWPWPNLGW